MANESFTLRIRKSWIRAVLGMAVVAAIVIPVAASASHTFTDVPDSNVFHDDIAWLADADVTKGCNPPTNDMFCPGNSVTREQMAAFMHRLADNQVVDAGSLEGIDSSGFVQAGQADSVTPAMTTAEAGVAQAASDVTVNLDGTVESLLEVTITAPAAGYVIVTGSADVFQQHTNGTNSFAFFGVSNQAALLGGDENKDILLDDTAPTGIYSEVVSMTKAFPVAAGANTFYLLALESSGVIQAGDMQLTALYVPTAYGAVEGIAPAATPAGADVAE